MQLTIEKLVYGGDGLARLIGPDEIGLGEASGKQTRGKAVFVPYVLPGEQVEARPVEEKPGFVRAALEKVLTPSSQRINPLCPYFQSCGGCHYQHIDYSSQLAIKRQILAETLERTAKIKWEGEIQVHPSPPWGYRNRTRLKVAAGPFALGYYRHNSHDLLPVESCPISSPLINRAITAIWEMGRSGEFVETALFEIELFANHADAELLLELYVAESGPKQLWAKLAERLRARLPVRSVSVFSGKGAPRKHSSFPEMQMEYCFQPEPFVYELETKAGGLRYQVSPGSFFQSNRFLTNHLVEIVCAGAAGKLAWDFYAGVGLFAAVLARTFKHVEAVEAAPSSFNDLEQNVPRNVRVHRVTTAAYLSGIVASKKPGLVVPNLVVIDPPRAGLEGDASRKLAAIAPARLTYVSCDPATLARDLRVFLQSGYALEQVHLVDLFPQTYHIETVVHLLRKRSA